MESLSFPVDVYFNLHKKVWSLRNRKSGLVERHARAVAFPHGAEMVVQAAGRARVLETGHKTVHAYVRGEGVDISADSEALHKFALTLPAACRITYNPRRAGYFTKADTGERIDRASALVMIAPKGETPQVWAVPA